LGRVRMMKYLLQVSREYNKKDRKHFIYFSINKLYNVDMRAVITKRFYVYFGICLTCNAEFQIKVRASGHSFPKGIVTSY
jgi:hypothetical protein